MEKKRTMENIQKEIANIDEQNMPQIYIDKICIIGKTIRTTNKDLKSMMDLPLFWQSFFQEGNIEKIPNKLHPEEILGIYYNFESDFTAAYDFMIGFEVNGSDPIPDGFISITIPSDNYVVFKNEKKMNLGEKVQNLWQNIWSSDIKRSYKFDFEEYELSSMLSENPKVKVYIGVE